MTATATTDDRPVIIPDPPADDRAPMPRAGAPAEPATAAGGVPQGETDRKSSVGPTSTSGSPGWQRPTFTITDAASACGVSRKTITRKLADLAGHGAAKDEDGIWRIPVEALLAVGLHPGRSLPESPVRASRAELPAPPVALAADPAAPTARVSEMVTISRDRWDDVRIRLARAEAEAAERALALADARLALRALTAGPAPVPTGGAAPAATGPGVLSPGPGADGVVVETGPERPVVPPSAIAPPPAAAATSETPARRRRWWQSRYAPSGFDRG